VLARAFVVYSTKIQPLINQFKQFKFQVRMLTTQNGIRPTEHFACKSKVNAEGIDLGSFLSGLLEVAMI
jgi:hypothetical protein